MGGKEGRKKGEREGSGRGSFFWLIWGVLTVYLGLWDSILCIPESVVSSIPTCLHILKAFFKNKPVPPVDSYFIYTHAGHWDMFRTLSKVQPRTRHILPLVALGSDLCVLSLCYAQDVAPWASQAPWTFCQGFHFHSEPIPDTWHRFWQRDSLFDKQFPKVLV